MNNNPNNAGKRPNRLINATSPYLVQHAYNPVDWHPWGDAAIERASAENKPIFLSIGYAACHWCHVMERESFENETIAALMNQHFVNIKVDREERPDLDDIYMLAVMSMTGRGGWPMSVFLTPALKPFYGGTYFPPENRYGMPGFSAVLETIAAAWQQQRDEVLEQAEQMLVLLKNSPSLNLPDTDRLSPELLQQTTAILSDSFDAQWGGWNGAPKFPCTPAIDLLFRQYQRTGEAALLRMATTTLDKMATGGLHDQLGGGFHRYSVDERWLVPHFEKMLYDNAQLASAYLDGYRVTGRRYYCDVARDTLDYIRRDLRHTEGGFFASEDADSEGDEGKFYLWRHDELMSILGETQGRRFCERYNILKEGNFSSPEPTHNGLNIPHLGEVPPPVDAAESAVYAEMRHKLRVVRDTRERPFRDDKILASWNALTISALAKAAQVLDDDPYLQTARDAGLFLRNQMMQEDRLMRSWRDGVATVPGYLDDYAFTVNAFLDLYETTFDFEWLSAARALADSMTARFHDPQAGGFFSTGEEHDHLLIRLKPLHDTAEPSGNALAARALLRLSIFFGDDAYADIARRALEIVQPMIQKNPQGCLSTLLVADALFYPPVELVIAGDPEKPMFHALLRVIAEFHIPNRVLVHADGAATRAALPLVDHRNSVDGAAAVYVCRDRACLPPCTTAETLRDQLNQMMR